MDKLVPQAYRQYGLYINQFRALPLFNDGLKPVERRVLLTTYMVAREKFVKSAKIIGNCMAKFHPHSEAYGTLFQLVKNGFIEGQGNWGSNLGTDPVPPAASRYTEAKISKETIEMAFNLIKHVPWSESELDDEPEYIPTKYPFCLMGNDYIQGIGFGFRTLIPCYTKSDLKARLFWLLSDKKSEEPIIMIKTNCKLLAKKEDFQQLLTVGKARIELQGVINVDNVHSRVILRSWPPGRRFEAILNKTSIKKQLDSQDIGFIDSSNGVNGTMIIFNVLKSRNKAKILKKFVKNLKLAVKGAISFENTTFDINRGVKVTSIDDMLLNTYNMYTKANQNMLNSEIDKTKDFILELNYLENIKEPLGKVLSKGTNLTKEQLPEAIKFISKESKVEEESVKYLLTKYRIQKLLTFQTDTKELKDKLIEIQKNLKNLNKFVLAQY